MSQRIFRLDFAEEHVSVRTESSGPARRSTANGMKPRRNLLQSIEVVRHLERDEEGGSTPKRKNSASLKSFDFNLSLP